MATLKEAVLPVLTKPVWCALALSLPVLLVLWIASRKEDHRHWLTRQSWILAALGAFSIVLFCWFNWVFVRSPLYLGEMSHLQPQIADVGWYFAQGKPVYHGPNSPEVYNLLYGPWLYVITGSFEKLFGPTLFSAKLGGALAVLVTLVGLFWLLRKKAGTGFALAGTGLFAALLMALDPIETLPRADIFITAFLIAGCWAAQSPSRFAPVGFGIAAGICFNLKIHAPVYFFRCWVRHGWPDTAGKVC